MEQDMPKWLRLLSLGEVSVSGFPLRGWALPEGNAPIHFPHGDGVAPWRLFRSIECTMSIDPGLPASPWQGPDQTCLLTKMVNAREAAKSRPPVKRYDPSQVQVDFLTSPPTPPRFVADGGRLEIAYIQRELDAARTSRDEYQACAEGLRDKLAASERALIGTRIIRDNNYVIAESRLKLVNELHGKLDEVNAQVKRLEIDRDAARRARDGYMEEAARLRKELAQGQAREKDLASRLATEQVTSHNLAEEVIRLRDELTGRRGRVPW